MVESVLKRGWSLLQIEPCKELDFEMLSQEREWLSIDLMPAQVQDVLLAHKKIPEDFLVGWCEDVNWITEYDWVYRTSFVREKEFCQSSAKLIFKGLDTFADIYLNGHKIIQHSNFYLPDEAEITSLLRDENDLVIHFHRVKDRFEAKDFPEEWEGQIQKVKILRKPVHDFDPENKWGAEYQGAVPYFQAIGVYQDILVQYTGEDEILDLDVKSYADITLDGFVDLRVSGKGGERKSILHYELLDADGNIVKSGEEKPCISGKRWEVRTLINIEKPELWWPIGYGKPYLYWLKVQLFVEEQPVSACEKRIGFKHVEIQNQMEFIINRKRVRIWGGSLDPLQGWTHCFLPERAERMYNLVENGHYNTLRIWGEGIPYPDEFYDMADEKGFLIWQEFFMGYGPVPDTEEYVEEYRKEATTLIRRLKHHACLLMWCGGNETIMGAQVNFQKEYGKKVLLDVFPKLVQEYDPGRYYYPSSPYFGEWSDDPRVGDVHTLDRVTWYPFKDYPNFVTEHCITAPPALHSLKKFVRGDLFPKGYTSLVKNDTELIMPKNWITRSSVGSLGQRKSGPYWEFYDADNAEDMIYRFGAAAGQELRRYCEMVRRGAAEEADPGQRSKGYVTCKLLDTWPKVYCSTIDFFLEGYIPYYTILRGFSPVMASFQKENNMRLWIVNDSGKTFTGKIRLGAYNLIKKEYFRQECAEIKINHCDAKVVYDFSKWHFIPMECVMFARVEDEQGNFVYQSVDYLDVERQLKFPDTELDVQIEGNELVITAKDFTRCVEILGSYEDDEMGWLFSDNYFDLMPGEKRRIRILAKDRGEIRVKGHYCSRATVVKYNLE